MPALSREVRNLIHKSREAALLAVENHNRPGTVFRTGAYIVMMSIAWTALFHAIMLKKKKKPYHKKPGTNRYIKIDGDYKTWELIECLRQYYAEENPPTRRNLEFFIRLRNKVEHHLLPELDIDLFGECQACLLNFERMLCEHFGERHALRTGLVFALQFSETGHPTQLQALRSAGKRVLSEVRAYVDRFRSSLSADVLASQEYSYKVFLVPKIGRDHKASDLAVEFIKYDPNKPEEMANYERAIALIKPKYINMTNKGGLKSSDVFRQVHERLGKKFTVHSHGICHQHFKIRPNRGAADPAFCDTRYCSYDEVHKDYVYTSAWVDFLVTELSKPAVYDFLLAKKIQPQAT